MATEKKTTEENTTTNTESGRVFRGTVVSVRAKDTVGVAVERYVKHPKYKKYIRRTKKILAHDPGNTCTEGDAVSIKETKPISKRKRFRVVTDETG